GFESSLSSQAVKINAINNVEIISEFFMCFIFFVLQVNRRKITPSSRYNHKSITGLSFINFILLIENLIISFSVRYI
ncbi:MAG: hypothetical protein KAQ79_16975, partial [Cyclobacteriaceae bacterium]|nr:hypothetical protein [Cyclobacteriaceae bacterium]